jgi:hypothetical protein
MLDFNLRSMNRRIAKCYRKGNVRERICRIRRIIRQAKYIFPDTSQFSLEKYNFRANSMKLHSSAGIYMQAAALIESKAAPQEPQRSSPLRKRNHQQQQRV